MFERSRTSRWVKDQPASLRGGNDVRGSAGPDFVNIAQCTIRLRHVDAADSDLYQDAKSSNMLFRRFY
jgi:hypothetical protein